jgi:hypothetical protein
LAPMEEQVGNLRAQVREQAPHLTARRSGADVVADASSGTTLALRLWETLYYVAWPEVHIVEASSGQPCSVNVEAALLYYLRTADGTSPSGQWVGFRELPGGTFYNRAFQGYSGDELVGHFGEDVASFRQAAGRAGGVALPLSDAGLSFLVLPRLSLAIVYWLGEEGIPTRAQVLFDKAASHYLPTDALAGMGAQLVHRIMRADARQ